MRSALSLRIMEFDKRHGQLWLRKRIRKVIWCHWWNRLPLLVSSVGSVIILLLFIHGRELELERKKL